MDAPTLPPKQLGEKKKIEEKKSKDEEPGFCHRYFSPYFATQVCHVEIDKLLICIYKTHL